MVCALLLPAAVAQSAFLPARPPPSLGPLPLMLEDVLSGHIGKVIPGLSFSQTTTMATAYLGGARQHSWSSFPDSSIAEVFLTLGSELASAEMAIEAANQLTLVNIVRPKGFPKYLDYGAYQFRTRDVLALLAAYVVARSIRPGLPERPPDLTALGKVAVRDFRLAKLNRLQVNGVPVALQQLLDLHRQRFGANPGNPQVLVEHLIATQWGQYFMGLVGHTHRLEGFVEGHLPWSLFKQGKIGLMAPGLPGDPRDFSIRLVR